MCVLAIPASVSPNRPVISATVSTQPMLQQWAPNETIVAQNGTDNCSSSVFGMHSGELRGVHNQQVIGTIIIYTLRRFLPETGYILVRSVMFATLAIRIQTNEYEHARPNTANT